jgi:4-hydroxybutyrate CoA-transferase
MRYKSHYTERFIDITKINDIIKNGNNVFIGTGCGEPKFLVDTFIQNCDKKNISILHLGSLRKTKAMEKTDRFRYKTFFVTEPLRQNILQNKADYIPCHLSQVPYLLKEKIIKIDIALIMVTPPDRNGFCSYGIAVDCTKAASESAKIVIAQINKKMPYTYGSKIHVSNIDFFVEKDDDLIEIKDDKANSVEKEIAGHVSDIIPDGSCLQIGFGKIPNALIKSLDSKSELGIHTELLSNGIGELIRKGVITNKMKNINVGRSIAAQIWGDKKLYTLVHHNPNLELHPFDYTNDPIIIRKNDTMISINSAFSVDLTGQISAESIGFNQYSGVGGQVDFMRGAKMSKKGKSIIVLKSISKNNTSNIVTSFEPGTIITTSRYDVDYVVTEYGSAYLKGKTLDQRKQSLIEIADPDFAQKLKMGS